jgi:hypothetical protein
LRRDLTKRLAVLEAKAEPRVISTWVDFVLWLDKHEDDEGDVDVELCPELLELLPVCSLCEVRK